MNPAAPLRLVLVMLPLVACAQADVGSPSEPPANARLLLVTAADWPSATALADAAATRAGVAVTRAATLGPRTFALTLACASEEGCRRAADRLGADKVFAVGVQTDRRRALPVRPSASSSQ